MTSPGNCTPSNQQPPMDPESAEFARLKIEIAWANLQDVCRLVKMDITGTSESEDGEFTLWCVDRNGDALNIPLQLT